MITDFHFKPCVWSQDQFVSFVEYLSLTLSVSSVQTKPLPMRTQSPESGVSGGVSNYRGFAKGVARTVSLPFFFRFFPFSSVFFRFFHFFPVFSVFFRFFPFSSVCSVSFLFFSVSFRFLPFFFRSLPLSSVFFRCIFRKKRGDTVLETPFAKPRN